MSRVAFHLPDAVSQRLQKLAARTGRSETEYMIEAIREYLDDLEDVHIAEQTPEGDSRGQGSDRAS